MMRSNIRLREFGEGDPNPIIHTKGVYKTSCGICYGRDPYKTGRTVKIVGHNTGAPATCLWCVIGRRQ